MRVNLKEHLSDVPQSDRSRKAALLTVVWLSLVLSWACPVAAQSVAIPKPDPDRAFQYLVDICDIGPRISGTEGMRRQQERIEEHFLKFGAAVRYQAFDAVHPRTGEPVRMKNMVVTWHPESRERVLIACHYDTRPRPDRELLPINRDKPFIGANDGASGVALLMELAHHMDRIEPIYGVDFVFFDGEELVYTERDKYFLGSEHFSRQYRDHPPEDYRYVAGVLVDMVAGKNLKLYFERYSLRYAPEVTRSVWEVARQLGIREFIPRPKHRVKDDHLPLNEIAGIPTCDIIDFDYPYWHKRNDLPAACSGDSLAKVGHVILGWLATYRHAE